MKLKISKVIKDLFLVVIAVLGTTATTAQSVQKIGANPTTINPSAALEIESTTKGFLPPRMTTTQRNVLASPTVGLVIYNTDKNCLEYYNGTGWYNRCDGSITAISGGYVASGSPAVVASWTSTLGCRVGGVMKGGVNQTMVQGTSATGAATITLVADVTTAGTYNIITNTVNEVSFSASGNFTATGTQTVTLTANGTPTLAGNYIWTINTTPSITIYGSVLTTNAPLGSSYNAHFNGIISGVNSNFAASSQTTGETFNTNTTCQNQPISAQGCAGVTTVITSSGRVHNTVNINGQCWLQTNLIEVPSVYSGYGQGSWLNTAPSDQGYWGYYNTATVDGSAGWGGSEPVTNEGLLYQWCGAMNGTISNRSRGICPAGWHIPSDCEWMYLEHGQGMSIAEQNGTGFRGNGSDNQGTAGYKLRSQGTGQTNASGFSGLLIGKREITGTFSQRTTDTSWWSSSIDEASPSYPNYSFLRYMSTNTRGVNRFSYYKIYGTSVRCLKD